MCLKRFLIHITHIVLCHILYLVYLCPCIGLDLFMSVYVVLCICRIFHFHLHFLHNQSYNPIKTDTLVFTHFYEYFLLFLDNNLYEESKKNSDSKRLSVRVLLRFCLIFIQFQPGVAYKSVVYKKACISDSKS